MGDRTVAPSLWAARPAPGREGNGRNRSRLPFGWVRGLFAVLGLVILAAGGVRAQTTYKIQPVFKVGDMAGGVLIPSDRVLVLGPVSDHGQILFDAGSLTGSAPDIFVEDNGGNFIPIVAPGRDGAMGPWPVDDFILGPGPQSMNAQGNVVFALGRLRGNSLGTFVWDAQTQRATAIAVTGMPAVQDLTFRSAVGAAPAINDPGQVALSASVTSPTGLSGGALFFWQGGKLQPVLLPAQQLADGEKVQIDDAPLPSLNNVGSIAFLARRQGDTQESAYLWAQGAVSPLVLVGSDAPGGGKFSSVGAVLINSKNSAAVVAAGVNGSRRQGLYRVTDGKVAPVVAPGDVLPGGGTLQGLQTVFNGDARQLVCIGISAPSAAGEHIVTATLEDGTTAAYRLDAGGQLALILRSGTSTPNGTVTDIVGNQAGINSQGQVALIVQFDGGPETIVLLTPNGP